MGGGKLGLLIALALRHFNPGLLLIGKHPEKLAVAEEQCVETKIINSRDDLTTMAGHFDIVIEATGRADGINDAILLTRPEGIVVVKTTSHLPSIVNLAQLVVNEKSSLTVGIQRLESFMYLWQHKCYEWRKLQLIIQRAAGISVSVCG
ncbi:MAG: hypothetical protein PHO01_09390 [Desulfotomaculaceae bacterium]|nr:hypothetical protein [Desulfotomaculaceae bacterium]